MLTEGKSIECFIKLMFDCNKYIYILFSFSSLQIHEQNNNDNNNLAFGVVFV